MPEKSNTCGSSTITYDSSCLFGCICSPKSCSWTVICGGKVVVKGNGTPRVRDPRPGTRPGHWVNVDGTLDMIAVMLEEAWDRPVEVPSGAGDKRIEKTVQGTPEQIAKKLGLRLV